MTWLAWRQLRVALTLTLLGAAAVFVLLVVTQPGLVNAFRDTGAGACAAGDRPGGILTCGDIERGFLARHSQLRALAPLLLVLPALLGAFWGAPLVARELEAGTHRFAWVQSVSRTRWLASKLLVALVPSLFVAAVLSLTFTWWSRSADSLSSRLGPGVFGQRGVAPVAYVAFAVAAGLLAGAVVRRTVPAMAVTVAAFVAARLAVQSWVRPRLADAEVVRYPTFTFRADDPPGLRMADQGWVLASRTIDASGNVVSEGALVPVQAASRMCGLASEQPTKQELDACGERLGLENVVEVVPSGDFWPLQLAEAAVFVALAIVLAAAAFWWVRRRVD